MRIRDKQCYNGNMKNNNVYLTPANEDYLEAILILEKSGEKIKSVQIAKMLNVSKPGVNKAMNILKNNGLIEKDDYSDIILTDKGRRAAEQIYGRHVLIYRFLILLGVSKKTAEIDCCKIEHILSEETLKRIKAFCDKHSLK